MRGLPPVTIRTAERRFRSGPNLLSDLKILAVDGLAPKWFSSSTTQDSMGIEWMTVIYQRPARRLLRARLFIIFFRQLRPLRADSKGSLAHKTDDFLVVIAFFDQHELAAFWVG